MATPKVKKESWHISESRVAEALALVARDIDGRYDECFVERILESSQDYLKGNTKADENLLDLYQIYDQINTTRLLKFHKSMVEANSPTPAPSRQLTIKFLNVLPSILIKNDPSEVAAAIALLLALAYDDTAIKDLVAMRLTSCDLSRSLKIGKVLKSENGSTAYQSTNILDLARYFMLESRNYHMEENAKYLFISLIMKLSDDPSPTELLGEMRQMLEDLLMNVKSCMVYHIICELFEIAPDNCLTTELFQYIKRLLRRALDQAIEEKSHQSMLGLSKCMSKAKISVVETLDKLKRANNLDAIIMFVTNMNVFNQPSLFYFVIYPILLKCDSEDAQVLAAKLFITRDEKYFIERNLNDRLVQQCLVYLRLCAFGEPPFAHHSSAIPIPFPKLTYSLDVALEYLKCNYDNTKAYKNLLECCSILLEGQTGFKKSIWIFLLIDELFHLIDKTNLEARPQLRPIFLAVLQLLARSHHRSSVFRSQKKLIRFRKNWYHIVNVAFQYTDPEVLYEFATFFHLTSCELMPESQQHKRYVQLIWQHMLPIAREGEHHELIGILAAILIKIDLDTPKSALDAIDVLRHRDIPKLVSEILLNYSTVYSVVEKIIKCLVSVDAKEPGSEAAWARTKVSYLEWLDNEGLPRYVRNALNHLIRGVCTAIKGECDEEIKVRALCEINNLISTFLINDDSPERLLRRLIRTGILEMLYVVSTCSLYSDQLQEIASYELPKIRRHILEKLGSNEQVVPKLVNVLVEDKAELQERAQEMAQFLTKKTDKMVRRETNKDHHHLGLASFLSDVLDYPRIDWGPSECY